MKPRKELCPYRVGEEINGRYKIIEELGVRTFHTSFLVEDIKASPGKRLVLKCYKAGYFKGWSARRGAKSTVRATKALKDDLKCVPYSAFERGRAGEYLLVRPFVEGQSLRERLNELGHLPVLETIDILEQCASTIKALTRGVALIYGNLKPENIILRREDNSSQVKIILTDPLLKIESRDESLIRLSGDVGARYIAPERIIGPLWEGDVAEMMENQGIHSYPFSLREDIFSLGALGFEMLTGRRAWEEKSLNAHFLRGRDNPVPPLTPSRYVPTSSQLELVINRCVQRYPRERYQMLDTFLNELRWAKNKTAEDSDEHRVGSAS